MVKPLFRLVGNLNLDFSVQAVHQTVIWASGTKNISNGTVVWVANRETPLNNTLGIVRVHSKGITLLMSDESDSIIWSVNTSRYMKNTSVQLLNTRNLVLSDEDQDFNNVENIWQSFDHPGDTQLPGMKFGVDLVTGINRYYTSWKSVDDPSLGCFTYRLDFNGFPQFILWKEFGNFFKDWTMDWSDIQWHSQL